MNLRLNLICCSLIFSATSSLAQLKDNSQIGISLFRIELNDLTQGDEFEPKLVTNLSFETGWSSFRLTTNLEYAANQLHEYCRSCADVPMGDSWMREFNFYLGVKYLFLSGSHFPVKPFIELRGLAGFGDYEGIFTGGWSSDFQISQHYRTWLAGINLGVEIIAREHFRISYQAFYQLGQRWFDDTKNFNLTEDYQKTTTFNSSPFGFTLSYHF
ncbi:MAG: hypothetical protein IPM74_08995 [Crocinitomicaceae bacterium]|nr:hypothetical protein [Crocinitomicaceae bacterium]MBK8926027.1 hypothetical protein [Crocinitomicaceae bacterium]